jgi:hypothetical protein
MRCRPVAVSLHRCVAAAQGQGGGRLSPYSRAASARGGDGGCRALYRRCPAAVWPAHIARLARGLSTVAADSNHHQQTKPPHSHHNTPAVKKKRRGPRGVPRALEKPRDRRRLLAASVENSTAAVGPEETDTVVAYCMASSFQMGACNDHTYSQRPNRRWARRGELMRGGCCAQISSTAISGGLACKWPSATTTCCMRRTCPCTGSLGECDDRPDPASTTYRFDRFATVITQARPGHHSARLLLPLGCGGALGLQPGGAAGLDRYRGALQQQPALEGRCAWDVGAAG